MSISFSGDMSSLSTYTGAITDAASTELTDYQLVTAQADSLAGIYSGISDLLGLASGETGLTSSNTLSAATMITALQLMPNVTTSQMNSASLMSDTQNVMSTVGNLITAAQGGLNAMIGTTGDATDAQTFYNSVEALVGGSGKDTTYQFSVTVNGQSYGPYNGLLSFLSDSSATGPWGGAPPLSSQDASTITTALSGALSTVEAGLGTTWPSSTPPSNKDFTAMGNYIYGLGQSPVSASGSSLNGTISSVLSGIQGDLNQAFQSVTSMSTAEQTNLSFQMQTVNQFFGITQSIQQSISDANAYMIQKMHGS